VCACVSIKSSRFGYGFQRQATTSIAILEAGSFFVTSGQYVTVTGSQLGHQTSPLRTWKAGQTDLSHAPLMAPRVSGDWPQPMHTFGYIYIHIRISIHVHNVCIMYCMYMCTYIYIYIHLCTYMHMIYIHINYTSYVIWSQQPWSNPSSPLHYQPGECPATANLLMLYRLPIGPRYHVPHWHTVLTRVRSSCFLAMHLRQLSYYLKC
jgi:hypothetical protein